MLIGADRCEVAIVAFSNSAQSKKEFLAQAFADDLNVTTGCANTVMRIFKILEDFRKISGLKVNVEKSSWFWSYDYKFLHAE